MEENSNVVLQNAIVKRIEISFKDNTKLIFNQIESFSQSLSKNFGDKIELTTGLCNAAEKYYFANNEIKNIFIVYNSNCSPKEINKENAIKIPYIFGKSYMCKDTYISEISKNDIDYLTMTICIEGKFYAE